MRAIDADAHWKVLEKLWDENSAQDFADACVWDALEEAPTLDVRPVVHGKWKLDEGGWYCSVCELYPPFDCDPEEKGIPLCPYCGADMRELNGED